MRLTHGPKYQWIILAMATLGVLAAIGLGRFGYSAILPSMQKGLGLNNTEAGRWPAGTWADTSSWRRSEAFLPRGSAPGRS